MSADRSWEARPVAARAIRLSVMLGPILLGAGAAIAANEAVPVPSTVAMALARALLIVALATLVVWAVDRYARRLLPLAALMQLSLVFPDRAPSRFRSALKAGSSRRLERTLEETRRNGLSKDPGDAARQVVQLIGAIGDHDRRTRGHSERVRLFADLVGEELKLSKEERQKLQWGALLHDLGKLMVPSEILNKKGKPDAEEWRILQGHPAAGMELIEPLRDFFGEWVHAIGGHHEKWDGSGYPAGLRGGQIPRSAAIVAVADSFEVMTAVRSYKKAMPLTEARAELTRCAGTHFSPEVVRAFLSISLGHLRIASGPLAALAHLPFVGNLAQLPAIAATAVPAAANAAAIPMAAVVTAAALTVGSPPKADAFEEVRTASDVAASAPVNAKAQPNISRGRTPVDTPTATADPGSVDLAGVATDPTTTADDSARAGATGTGSSIGTESGTGTTRTTTTSTSAAGGTPTTQAASPSTAPAAAPAAPAPPPTSPAKKTTPTTSPPPTTPPPTAPPTTAAPPTTTVAPWGTFTISVSTTPLRMPSQALNGASFGRGTNLYVYLFTMSGPNRIDYTFPGGTHTATMLPFDMVGSTGFGAQAWKAPTTPGTYTITAVGRGGSGPDKTATATFTIT